MKTLSIRLDDTVAALVAERARRKGVSINQEINDALVRDAQADFVATMEWTDREMEKYATVMERL
ncbi:MAG TPA: hypothetical protein PKV27_12380, partial [Ilumatobacteraceae bacterium]|nr:hypothetical protein [Ilumatobacteraceae bacterium]